MYHIHMENKLKPYEVSSQLHDETFKFEIDSGAGRSILCEGT